MYLIELSLSYLVCCVMLTLLRMKLIWELTLWTDLTGTCRYRLTYFILLNFSLVKNWTELCYDMLTTKYLGTVWKLTIITERFE